MGSRSTRLLDFIALEDGKMYQNNKHRLQVKDRREIFALRVKLKFELFLKHQIYVYSCAGNRTEAVGIRPPQYIYLQNELPYGSKNQGLMI